MDSHPFEEEIGSICCYDALIMGCDNDHIRKPINHHKYRIIDVLGGRKTRYVIHRDGFPRPLRSRKRGVYALLLDGWFGNGTGSARYDILVDVLSKFSPHKNVLPSDCSEPPKFHAHLWEQRGGLDGIRFHPGCESRWHPLMYPRPDRWWQSQVHADKVGATQMPHAHRNGALW
jgi:hypothetical protein